MPQLRYAGLTIGFALIWLTVGCGGTNAAPTASPNPNAAQGPGKVHVFTFNDLNSNGTPDGNEPGVQDSISLGKGTTCAGNTDEIKAQTGADGKYTFNDVEPGSYCVIYKGSETTRSPLTIPVLVKAGQELYVNFAILFGQ